MRMLKIFSEFVFGDTFPNPTLVKLLNVKYNAVTYFDCMEGPPVESFLYIWWVCLPNSSNQPIFGYGKWGRSKFPIAYQIQANQWAMRAKVAMSNNNMAAPYSEYLSNFLATRTRRNNLAVFNKPIRVVVWKIEKENKYLDCNFLKRITCDQNALILLDCSKHYKNNQKYFIKWTVFFLYLYNYDKYLHYLKL